MFLDGDMAEKRPFLDYGDLLILLGVVLTLLGFYWLAWRLALIYLGLLLMVFGMLRLRRIERGKQ